MIPVCYILRGEGRAPEPQAATKANGRIIDPTKLGVPGPYPGRVVEVRASRQRSAAVECAADEILVGGGETCPDGGVQSMRYASPTRWEITCTNRDRDVGASALCCRRQ